MLLMAATQSSVLPGGAVVHVQRDEAAPSAAATLAASVPQGAAHKTAHVLEVGLLRLGQGYVPRVGLGAAVLLHPVREGGGEALPAQLVQLPLGGHAAGAGADLQRVAHSCPPLMVHADTGGPPSGRRRSPGSPRVLRPCRSGCRPRPSPGFCASGPRPLCPSGTFRSGVLRHRRSPPASPVFS